MASPLAKPVCYSIQNQVTSAPTVQISSLNQPE